MTNRIAIPLPDRRWLVLDEPTFRAALAAGDEFVPNTSREPACRAERRELLTAVEAGRLLGVDASWLLLRARRREIPYVKLGKYLRFDPDAVIAHCAKPREG